MELYRAISSFNEIALHKVISYGRNGISYMVKPKCRFDLNIKVAFQCYHLLFFLGGEDTLTKNTFFGEHHPSK